MPESPYVRSAAIACRALKRSESLLAQAGFYESAASVRKEREQIEECTVESVEKGRPATGEYKPRTIKDVAHD